MFDIDTLVSQLASNAQAIRALTIYISTDQENWKPNPDTWSMKDVLEHLYNEERIDFRKHLKEMFSDPPLPWGDFEPESYLNLETCQQALDGFLRERAESISWLETLTSPRWDNASQATFGPNEVYVFKAGDVFVSWVAHDFLHIRQINELLFAWNEAQAAPFSVQYAGGW